MSFAAPDPDADPEDPLLDEPIFNNFISKARIDRPIDSREGSREGSRGLFGERNADAEAEEKERQARKESIALSIKPLFGGRTTSKDGEGDLDYVLDAERSKEKKTPEELEAIKQAKLARAAGAGGGARGSALPRRKIEPDYLEMAKEEQKKMLDEAHRRGLLKDTETVDDLTMVGLLKDHRTNDGRSRFDAGRGRGGVDDSTSL